MRDHVKDRLEDYLAGELEPEALESFEQHIRSCRSCEEDLRDTRDAHAYLKWLVPLEEPPKPGPEFYSWVQKSIRKKTDSGGLGNLFTALYVPRMAYALLFLLFGLLLAAWNTTLQTDWGEAGVLGIPPARFSAAISSEADRMRSRDMVMVSLVEATEGQ